MNGIIQKKMNADNELKDKVNTENIVTLGQMAPYVSQKFAEYMLTKKQHIISVYPTLYLAMQAFERLAENQQVLFFGADEFVSAQILSASPELMLQRIQTFEKIYTAVEKGETLHLITHIAGITRPIMSFSEYKNMIKVLENGYEIEREAFIFDLIQLGYERVPLVEKIGDFAIRGEVIDIFSPCNLYPHRLAFFDTEVEMIFSFDVATQLTIQKVEQCRIIPVTDQGEKALYSIVDYLEKYSIIEHQAERVHSTYEHLIEDAQQFKIKQEQGAQAFFIPYEELTQKAAKLVKCNVFVGELDIKAIDLISEKKDMSDALCKIVEEYQKDEYDILLLIGALDEKVVLAKLAEKKIAISQPLFSKDCGYNEIIGRYKTVVVDYYDLLGYKNQTQSENTVFKHLDMESKLGHIDEISPGDYIVHTKHGIGRYDGIQKISSQDIEKDFIVLSYQKDEKVYLPVDKITTLYKYVGSKEGFEPKLSKIGDKTWKKKTDKVTEHVEAFAQELFTLYMERERLPGFAFPKDGKLQYEFEAAFTYAETKDQLLAIREIKNDMEAPYIMERLLCGDVGFGKTEVAFRAAFKAMLAGKQVVLLAPTTILAKQHFENALKRFEPFGFKVGMLSRLVDKKKQEEVLFNLELGEIQLLIGTHRVLSKDIIYADLGLVLIDEEHRFGVASKEQLKRFKTEVDVLLISATPIPRTLQMAITGIREMSLLQTPPHNRYPVQTYVLEQNEHLVKDAVERELARKGQTYYLYNKVKSIENMTAKLQKLIPNAIIAYAHGQMPKKQLEDIIEAFVSRKIDVLVSTTIIENGMDIPNANTLIVHDADMLGLAQLYQLRGRVGRSQKIAYSYFMYRPHRILTEEAVKRLQTVQSFTEFGSGYHIAMRDLAIRGAGDVLGRTQSGFINDVGFDLYVELLQSAIAQQKNSKGGEIHPQNQNSSVSDIEVSLNIPGFIPSTYISDESVKIEVYQLLGKINSMEKLAKTRVELTNRFGKLPDELTYLLYVFMFKGCGRQNHVQFIRQLKNKVMIQFNKKMMDRLSKIGIQEEFRKKGLSIETKYTMGVLQLSITTMRKEIALWLYEIFTVIEIVNKNIR